jgi:hypothetical protein
MLKTYINKIKYNDDAKTFYLLSPQIKHAREVSKLLPAKSKNWISNYFRRHQENEENFTTEIFKTFLTVAPFEWT